MHSPFGQRLKHWRRVRRVSQLDLSLRSGVSPRHVSFLETGRSRPGRDVILRLADALDIPPRDRNVLLEAAGLPPAYGERNLDDAALTPFRHMLDRMLAAHAPFPALLITAWWELVEANPPARRMMGMPEAGPLPSVSLLDALLESGRERFVDYPTTAHTLLDRLAREAAANPDPRLLQVLERTRERLAAVPRPRHLPEEVGPALRTQMRAGDQVLTTVAAVARFTDALDATLDDLRVELLFPADDATEAWFRAQAGD